MITFDQLIAQNTGKGVDFDGAFGFQCVDLAQFYNRDVVGCPIKLVGAGAKDIWNTYPQQYYTRTVNGATNFPVKGDIIIWNSNMGNGNGHIAIVISANSGNFTSFDQNWEHPYCLTINHNYTNVLGWLHPIAQQPSTDWQKAYNDLKNNVHNEAFSGDNDMVARNKIRDMVK